MPQQETPGPRFSWFRSQPRWIRWPVLIGLWAAATWGAFQVDSWLAHRQTCRLTERQLVAAWDGVEYSTTPDYDLRLAIRGHVNRCLRPDRPGEPLYPERD